MQREADEKTSHIDESFDVKRSQFEGSDKNAVESCNSINSPIKPYLAKTKEAWKIISDETRLKESFADPNITGYHDNEYFSPLK